MGGLTITARISRLSREGSDHGFQEEVSHYRSREQAGRRMGHTFTARIDASRLSPPYLTSAA